MGRMTGIKWEKSHRCAPIHNIISSDFPKYTPQPWKFMPLKYGLFRCAAHGYYASNFLGNLPTFLLDDEGNSRMEWLMSYEYQRMWLEEREQWKKRIYPENTTVNVDIVKRYVLSFKTDHTPPKQEKKKPFKMKKFEGIDSKTKNKRPADDKAMAFEKEKTKAPAEAK